MFPHITLVCSKYLIICNINNFNETAFHEISNDVVNLNLSKQSQISPNGS